MTSPLRVQNLCFSYPDRPAVLDHLTFEMNDGETAALVGPNGAGKTTLFLCLAGVLPSSPGQIQVMGLDPAKPGDRKKLPSQVGIVFQQSDDQIFNPNVFDDVAFGPLNLGFPAEEVKSRVANALSRVGLNGYESRITFHLSGGEKRRVALAGVLAMSPQVLLLDEPSIFLDPRGRRDLIRLLGEIPGTKIIASHDYDLILDTCSRVLLLDQGKIFADGPAKNVLGNAGLMEKHGLEVPYRLR